MNCPTGIRALGLLLAAAVTVIATAVGPYTPIAGAQADADAAAEATGLAPLEVRRRPPAFDISTCLRGFEQRGSALVDVENTVSLFIDGELAQVQSAAIRHSLPPIDGTPDPTEPCSGTSHWFGMELPVSTIAEHGVQLPGPGAWTSFQLTAVLEFEEHAFSATRTVDMGGAGIVGELSSATPTPDGVRLGGWLADPETAYPVRYRVTVDGLTFPFVTSTRSDVPAHGHAKHLADGSGPASWDERELGSHHAIDAVVPYGTVCVHALVDADAPFADGFQTIGCITTISGAVRGAIGTITPRTGGARIRGDYFNPWIGPGEPLPGLVLVPDQGRPMGITSAVRRTNLPPAYGELAGWFDFDVEMALPPGRRTVCLRDGSWNPPAWAPELGLEPQTFGCKVVQVPHLPEGAAEVTVRGGP